MYSLIIVLVTEPTEWVSSMVIVQKRNGKVRACLGPRNLNQAIMCSHYPLPTIEEIATQLANAKLFSVLDQVESSSYLTAFNTPDADGKECLLVSTVHLRFGNMPEDASLD